MSSSTLDRNEEAFGADFPAVLLALAVFVELQLLLVFSFTSHASLQFQKVAEGLFSIPPFLQGHLAMVMEGRDVSVCSFLPAQGDPLHALCDQEK